jgi:broad specificity phosphatase PhoE
MVKEILLVRHGKSEHNVLLDRFGAGDLTREEFLAAYLGLGVDPLLTLHGREMAVECGRMHREALCAVQLFVVSPL